MIKQHFQNELVKHGYPADLTIEYSLGYCQGDGMAFYGSLGVDDVQALMKRLFGTEQGQTDAVSRVKNLMAQPDLRNMINVLREYAELQFCEVDISRNSFGQHYSHWNTMRIDSNVDFTGFFLMKRPCWELALRVSILRCWCAGRYLGSFHWKRSRPT